MLPHPYSGDSSPVRRHRRAVRPVTFALAASAVVSVIIPGTLRPAEAATTMTAQVWLTTASKSALLAQQSSVKFNSTPTTLDLAVDASTRGQTYLGAGASMTGSAASLINALPSSTRTTLMNNLFGKSGLRLNLLRQPLGASDYIAAKPFYTYEDVEGVQDYSRDSSTILPLVKKAEAENSELKVIGSPWSAPAWMKSSGSLTGGALNDSSIDDYATYLVQVAKDYASAGVPLAAMTIGNEPTNSTSYPSMTMTSTQMQKVLRAVDTKLTAAGLGTDLLAWDDNWSGADTALSLLKTVSDVPRVIGAAFHCYSGSPEQMTPVVSAGWTAANTECSGTDSWFSDTFSDTLMWQTENLVIRSLRAGASSVMLWNLALDANGGPNFGVCGTRCNAVVQIDGSTVTANAEYYVLGQLSRFVRPGAVRLGSPTQDPGGVIDVVMQNPDGSRVAIIENETSSSQSISITDSGASLRYTIPAKSVATFVWTPSS